MYSVRVNGHKRWFDHLSGFRQAPELGRGTYTVLRHDTRYEIYGGRHAGGRRGEWYVTTAEWAKPIKCVSLMDALTLLETL
jgi:hypothetical protein